MLLGFLKIHDKMKTLGLGILVLKIREFNTLKTCIKNGYQTKSVAQMSHFREAKRYIDFWESGVSEGALGTLAASAMFH